MDHIKDQSPESQLRQSLTGYFVCTVPLAIAALVISTTNSGCTIVNGTVVSSNATSAYPLFSFENPLNLFLIVWGGAGIGLGLFQLVSSYARTKNEQSNFLKVIHILVSFIAVAFAFGCFVWSVLLRFEIASACEKEGDPLWTMFVVAVVFACLSGICMSITFVCMLCAVCAIGLFSTDHTQGLVRL